MLGATDERRDVCGAFGIKSGIRKDVAGSMGELQNEESALDRIEHICQQCFDRALTAQEATDLIEEILAQQIEQALRDN